MTAYPPIEVTLSWEKSDGKPATFTLTLYRREKKANARNYINSGTLRTLRPSHREAELLPVAEA